MKLAYVVCLLLLLHFGASEKIHFTQQDVEKENKNKNYAEYQLNVPGSRPITIYEADSPYSTNRRVSTGAVETIDTQPISFSVLNNTGKVVHTQTLLEKFLEQFQKQNEQYHQEPTATEADELALADSQGRRNKRPQQGWVSLEAVPTYTSAKVYKWSSANRPQRPPGGGGGWDDNFPQRPHEDFNDDQGYQIPPKPFGQTYPSNKYKPQKPDYEKPSYGKPSYDKPEYEKPYGKPSYNKPNYSKPPYKPSYDRPDSYEKPYGFEGEEYSRPEPDYKPYSFDDRYSIKNPWNDVVTDNRPSSFPEPPQPLFDRKKDHPETYPGVGEGQWVLVSTTKGEGVGQSYAERPQSYSPHSSYRNRQKGQRAIGETASVSTVLHVIPNKNSVNVTTHNGEMIEVGHNSRKAKEMRAKKQLSNKRVSFVDAADATGPVYAAVGAGLIPATLSLVAPIVLGRRRRRRRGIESQIPQGPPNFYQPQ